MPTSFGDKATWLYRNGGYTFSVELEGDQCCYWVSSGGAYFKVKCKDERDGIKKMYLRVKNVLFKMTNGDNSDCPMKAWRSVV